MFHSSTRRGNVISATKLATQARRRRAIGNAIEPLETRTFLSSVTYIVQGNSDNTAPLITASGAGVYKTNTLRAAIASADAQPYPATIEFNAANFTGGVKNTITLTSGLTLGPTGKAGPHAFTLIGPTAKPITISGAGLYTDFTVASGVSATIQTLTLANGSATSGGAGGAIASNGTLKLVGDTFVSNRAAGSDGGAVDSQDGLLTVTNCAFTGNTAQSGGAIFINDTVAGANPTITGSTFTSNAATDDGGAVENYSNINSRLTVSNTRFTSDSAGSSDLGGGAIFSYSSAGTLAATISFSTFNMDSSPQNGGALNSQGTSLSLNSDSFSGDKSTAGFGGAVYSLDATATASNTTFNNNLASQFGGALFFAPTANPSLTVTTCTFGNNSTIGGDSTTGFGGAICDSGGAGSVFTLTGSTFTSNKAANYGGAVYSQGGSGSMLTATHDTFTSNVATSGDGGALDSYDDTLAVTNSTFISDVDKAGYGGGINSYALSLTAANDTFTNDSAYAGGGGIEFYGAGTGSGGNTADISPAISGPDGAASISDSTFTADIATAGSGGGVQSSSSELDLTGCTFTSGNAGSYGGALDSSDLVVMADTDTFTGNTSLYAGGAVHYTGPSGSASVANSTFTDNRSVTNSEGGAIFGDATVSSLDVANDVFTSNSASFAGGAITFHGTQLSVEQSSFTGNSSSTNGGGAISSDAGTLEIFDSTFNGNQTSGGGGGAVAYTGSGTASIANDTFYDNSASGAAGGGALYINGDSTVTVTDCTLDANSAGFALGGGIQNDPSGAADVILDGDIVAGDTVIGTPNTASDLAGSFDTASTNDLIGDGAGQTGFTAGIVGGNFVGTDIAPVQPMLGALANNGGPTLTQVPAAGSLAIGNNQNWPVTDTGGDNVTATDQTGLNARPQKQGYDIGAYQTGGAPVVVTPDVTLSAPATVHLPASGTVNVQVPVTIDAATTSAIVLTYSTIGQTATSGHGDYSGVTNATLTIPAGSPAGTYYITIYNVKRETANGPYPKTFQVQLSAATNANLTGGVQTVTVTLV